LKSGASIPITGANVSITATDARELTFGRDSSTARMLFDLDGTGGIKIGNTSSYAWSSTTLSTSVSDLFLVRDAANILALRNSTNPQAFNIYNTFTDASNYERGCIKWSSNRFEIKSEVLGTGTARPHRFYLHSNQESWIEDTNASGGGYRIAIRNRYGHSFNFGPILSSPVPISLGDVAYVPLIHFGIRGSRPTGALNANVVAGDLHLCGKYGGNYAISTSYHRGTGITAWCGYGATPTDTDGDGGDAGNFDIWLNAGGAGNGSGDAGADGRFRIINDDTDSEVFAIDKSGNVYAANLPTSDPAVVGQIWNDLGTLKISAG
jgi:hypothetical protein